MSEPKSTSDDILNELFSTFNSSFSSATTATTTSPSKHHPKKSKKKPKKSKKSSRSHSPDSEGPRGGGGSGSDAGVIKKKKHSGSSSKEDGGSSRSSKSKSKKLIGDVDDKKKKKKTMSAVLSDKAKKTKKRLSSSSTPSPTKKSKKTTTTTSTTSPKKIKSGGGSGGSSSSKKGKDNNKSYKQVIGDGFVILKNSGYNNSGSSSILKELEDGEIIEDAGGGGDPFSTTTVKKSKKKSSSGGGSSSSESKKRRMSSSSNDILDVPSLSLPSSSKKSKLSASQAYRLDAEERLLLGYQHHNDGGGSGGGGSYKSSSDRDSSRDRHHDYDDDYRSSSSSSSRRRSKSPPPSSSSSSSSSRPRLAPPREVYKSSYLKFEKERDRDYHGSSSRDNGSSSSSSSRYGNSYDSASYYDYHSQRGRSSYSTAKGGFGYVGKSYYYDDVEEEEEDERRRRREHDDDDRRGGSGSRGRSDYRSSSSRDDRSGSSSSSWRHRHRSSSPPRRSYYHPEDIIDKAELLEIARKNANKLIQRGSILPSDIFSRDQILALRAGGKSVEELTMYCRRLAKRDACGDATDACDSDSDDEGSGGGKHFIHHPFMVKDKPLPTITLNIRNAVPLPVRTPQALAIESAKLRTQFPVSSGTQHRFKEIEWKPVAVEGAEGEKKEGEAMPSSSNAIVPLSNGPSTSSATGPNVATVAPMMKEDVVADEDGKKEGEANSTGSGAEKEAKQESSVGGGGLKAIEGVPPPTSGDHSSGSKKQDTGISVDGPDLPLVDIGSVIGLRLKAMRLLQENPGSGQAQRQLDEATQMMKHWADAKALEPKFLTVAELSSGPQAWAKRDQLRKTKALDSGMGMHLLQKMGWKPGEGLGKNKEGQLEPLALDVKTDKKGLTAAVEELIYGKGGISKSGTGMGPAGGGPSMPQVYDLSGKHPVSALMELTAKRRWGNPEFEMCFEHGPPHKRQFVYKVIVNGVEYQPCVAVGNKKQAKANAAAFCLQSLGLLPTGSVVGDGPGESLQTVESGTGGVQEPVGMCPPPPIPPSLLTQTFSGSGGNFLQTVNVPQPTATIGAFQPPQPVNSNERELMPPPPVPPPLMKFLR